MKFKACFVLFIRALHLRSSFYVYANDVANLEADDHLRSTDPDWIPIGGFADTFDDIRFPSVQETLESTLVDKYVDTRYDSVMYGDKSPVGQDCANIGTIPPDPIGAVGPTSLIAVTNVRIEMRDKVKGNVVWLYCLQDFFAGLLPETPPLNFGFDPKIVYDKHSDRFYVVCLFGDKTSTSFIYVAMSENSDPSPLEWNAIEIDGKFIINGLDYWTDYPGFEVDEEAIYITANLFRMSGSGYGGMRLWIFDKNNLAKFTVHDPTGLTSSIATTFMPAEIRAGFNGLPTRPAGSGTYLIGYSGLNDEGKLYTSVIKVTNPLNGPTFDQWYVQFGTLDVHDTQATFQNAVQLGSTADATSRIWTNNRRVLDAVWQQGSLWCVFTVAYPLSNTEKAYWLKLSTMTVAPSVLDQGVILGDDIASNVFTFFPSIAINSKSIVAFGFSASAETIFAGAYVTVRDDKTDVKGSVQSTEIVRQGEGFYSKVFDGTRNRWGDYTGMANDPVDDDCFWAYNQYAGVPTEVLGSIWKTVWARLCVPPKTKPSANPSGSPSVSAKPSANPSGSPSVSVTPSRSPTLFPTSPPTIASECRGLRRVRCNRQRCCKYREKKGCQEAPKKKGCKSCSELNGKKNLCKRTLCCKYKKRIKQCRESCLTGRTVKPSMKKKKKNNVGTQKRMKKFGKQRRRKKFSIMGMAKPSGN